MKKRFFSLFLCTALLLSIVFPAHTAWADTLSNGGGTYTDPETGATFVVPEGWQESKLVEGSLGPFEVQFITQKDSGNAFTYGSYDLWSRMPASERSGLTRSEINSAYIYAEGTLVKSFIDECRQSGIEIAADDVQLVTYGKNLSIEIPAVREVLDNSVSQLIIMHIENGYVHIFMLGSVNKLAAKDFRSVLNSFDLPRGGGEDFGDTYTDPDTGACFLVPEGWAGDAFNLEDAANFYQVKYISQGDSGSSFLYGSYDLWNTMSESRRSGHTRSEIDSAYIYEEWSSIESLVNLAPEQGITIDPADVHLVTHGKNEFIEIPEMLEMAGIRIEASLFWLVENGYVYTFMFLGTSDQAIQDFHSVLSSLQVSSSAGADRSSGGPYTDPDTGAVFVVPEGWIERELDEDIPEIFQVKFASQEYPGSNFMYGSADLWSTMTASERSGHIRADIDSAYIYAYEDGALIEYMAESMIQDATDTGGYVSLDKIALVTYGSNEMIEFSSSQEISGIRFPVTTIFHVENGYMYTFVFASNNDQATQDFQSVIDSFQISAAEAPGSDGNSSGQPDDLVDKIMLLFAKVLFFLGELAFTFFFLALPFFLYRNRFRKRPVGKIITLIIVIPYMILVYWLLMEVTRHYFTPWVPLIWCCFTYRDMTRKKDSDALPKNAVDGPAPQQPEQPVKAAPSTPAPHIPAVHTPATSVSAVSTPPAPAMPATPAPTVPAVPASTTSAAPTLPSPQPAAAPTPQTPPAVQSGKALAPAAPLWPAQYSHAQDMRVGFAKSSAKVPRPGPFASAEHSAPPRTASQSTPAAYVPASPMSAVQTPPPVPYVPAASVTAPQTSPAAPAVPASPVPAAYIPAASMPAAPAPQAPSFPEAATPTAAAPAAPAPQTPPPAPRIQFCRNCGFQLLEDSKFCSACGTPVAPVTKE